MNIKQAEHLSGVSKRNIRFYEQEGLVTPTRNKDNDYREYTEADIETLKRIRVLRMVDMPLDQIKSVLLDRTDLKNAATAQKERLEEKARELHTAICFCEEFGALGDIRKLDTDAVLRRMEMPENREGLFTRWINDYRKIAAAEHDRVFTFTPDTAVTTPVEFTLALCQYANENGLDLIITKESMYPEFTIDGIEYTAERFYHRVYRFPVATIRCTVKHPEDLAPDVPEAKKPLLTLLHHNWLLIPVFLLVLVLFWESLLTSWEGWVGLFSILLMIGACLWRTQFFYYNHDGKPRKK